MQDPVHFIVLIFPASYFGGKSYKQNKVGNICSIQEQLLNKEMEIGLNGIVTPKN